MQTKTIAIIMGITLAQYSSVAFGMASIPCEDTKQYLNANLASGCQSNGYQCYDAGGACQIKLYSCNACTGNKVLVQKTADSVYDCYGEFNYTTCECQQCTGRSCLTTRWTKLADGYETRTNATCNDDTCECIKTTEYRCAAGYYGHTVNGISGCNKCPDGGTSEAGSSTAITSCYIPKGSFSDEAGSGTVSDDCYYGV